MNRIERYKTDYMRRYGAGRVMRGITSAFGLRPHEPATVLSHSVRQTEPTFVKSLSEFASLGWIEMVMHPYDELQLFRKRTKTSSRR